MSNVYASGKESVRIGFSLRRKTRSGKNAAHRSHKTGNNYELFVIVTEAIDWMSINLACQ
jgi:hypothetical protein